MSNRDDELRRQIGTLWRTAMVGFDTVREVVVRSTQAGRLRVDIALLQRERAQLLETLGEMVVGLIDDGTLGDPPESVRQAYDRIKDVESRLKNDAARAHDNAFGAPRGFEPEAASDYGPDHTDDRDGDASGRARRAAPPRRPRKKGSNHKRKESAR